MSPIDVFNYLWNDEIIDHIVIETNRYHSSKFGKQHSVTNHEIRQFFGIMILSGYVTVPNRRQFWSNSPTTRNTSVVESGMTSKRFADIMASLHFADNSQIDQNDRIFKIRPIFDHFNKVFATLGKPYPDIWAIDEAMEPYFGRHGLKQFIRGKPVRFGFKLWCLCSKEGLLLKFKLYEGKDSGRAENLTVGENVVCELAKNFVPEQSHAFIDNFFTTLPLLDQFRDLKINLTGTIRKDRVRQVPINDFKKKSRGTSEAFQDKDKKLLVVNWQDNSDVIIASNYNDEDSLSLGKCNRWSKTEGKAGVYPNQKSFTPIIMEWVGLTSLTNLEGNTGSPSAKEFGTTHCSDLYGMHLL